MGIDKDERSGRDRSAIVQGGMVLKDGSLPCPGGYVPLLLARMPNRETDP
jgi:hypothetical protein